MSDWIRSESIFGSVSISEPPKWECGPTENPNVVAAEFLARHIVELTAAVQKLTEVIEKQGKA